MSFGLFANISSQSNYKNYITGQADRLFDYEYRQTYEKFWCNKKCEYT